MENFVVSQYREKIINFDNKRHLFMFYCHFSQINIAYKDIKSYFYIDSNDIFWLAKEIYQIFNKNKDLEKCIKKYVDTDIDGEQILVYKFDGKVTTKILMHVILSEIILAAKRKGTPRKKYKTKDKSIMRITLVEEIENKKEGLWKDKK